MENQTSLANEMALKIIDLLKGQTYYVAEKSIELTFLILKQQSLIQ